MPLPYPTPSVDPAHPVDRHFLDEGLGDELLVGLNLVVLFHRSCLSGWSGLDRLRLTRQNMASSAETEGRGAVKAESPGRVGRRRSTTRHEIADAAIELFASRGFDEVSVDDVAEAAGIARRTLFRYYPSKNAIPWGEFDSHLQRLRTLLGRVGPAESTEQALRDALLTFNTFDASEVPRHRLRMQVILRTPELQAYSLTMYAGWRDVIAEFVASRCGAEPDDLVPQTVAWALLGVALSAYEHWLADESVSLTQALGNAFDVVRPGSLARQCVSAARHTEQRAANVHVRGGTKGVKKSRAQASDFGPRRRR